MKKWFIVLAALALLLIPSVAMAKIVPGSSYFAYCPVDGTMEGYVNSEIKISEKNHSFNWLCLGCSYSYYINEPHYGGEATCSAKAKCEGCNAFYGEKNPDNHDWGPWQSFDAYKHLHICQTSGCNGVDYAAHTESRAATCQSAAYCADCKNYYGDENPNNHVGTPTTTYAKTSETQHTPTTTYSDCPHSVEGSPEAHTETTAATCTAAA